MKAPEILNRASDIMDERAKQYDSPEGERSMGKAVAAFNAITGQKLSEANGWLLMALLKMVRDNTTEAPHEDSIHDLVAYAGLYGESRLSGIQEEGASKSASSDAGGWIEWRGGECPVPRDTLVSVMLRSGSTYTGRALNDLDTCMGELQWKVGYEGDNKPTPYDIIAYRIVK